MWPDERLLDLLGLEFPIVQAPMAGASGSAMAIAVGLAGGLGSLPCALLAPAEIEAEVARVRAVTSGALNLNFFCHPDPVPDPGKEAAWRARLDAYYMELGAADSTAGGPSRAPFDGAACALVERLRPEVVSFHFGLPEPALFARVRAVGCRILASATTVAEARWLEARGCDAIIAQGVEAGGHRGMFLEDRPHGQPGTMALVPEVVDAVRVPVIAAGGIADGRGIAAAFALGAAGVQLGTAFLFTPEALISPLHRAALASATADRTVLTNVFTGRPARGIENRLIREQGPISSAAPAFPRAAGALAPLRAAAEARGSGEFSPFWSGQAASLCRAMGATELTRRLAADALERFRALCRSP